MNARPMFATSTAESAALDQPQHPSCFNRADFVGEGVVWLRGCPHWKEGGNAQRLASVGCFDRGAKTFPWSACEGCRHRDISLSQG